MHELALYINDRKADKEKYSIEFKSGTVVDIVTDFKKLDLWLQIICEFPRPEKRVKVGQGFRTNRGWSPHVWDTIVEGWTPFILKTYQDYDRLPMGNGLEKINKRAVANQIWNEYIANHGGFLDAIGNDVTGRVNLTESWPWSPVERQNMFIITNNDGSENGETDIKKKAVRIKENDALGKPIYKMNEILMWKTDIGLSPGTIADIENPSVQVHPRFDKPVSIYTFKHNHLDEPLLHGLL